MPISAEYAAGFFDGEGCVNITLVGKARQPRLRIYLTNTNRAVLGLFQSEFGGSMSTPQILGKGWKPHQNLILYSVDGMRFLKLIRPYVLIKKAQVELGIAFLEEQQRPKSVRCHYEYQPQSKRSIGKVRPEVQARETEAKAIMGMLNRKGV